MYVAGREYVKGAVLAFCLLLTCGSAYGQMITVRPGQLSHFTVSAPDEAIAGEDFFLQVKAHDNKGNVITNYGDVGKSVNLVSSGSQALVPKTLSATSFIGGVATVKAVYYKAEKITVTVKDYNETASGKSGAVNVKPNSIHHFAITAPGSVKAGENFSVKVTALDAFENIINDYNALGKGVNVSTSGTSKISPNFVAASAFREGVANITFAYNKAENVTVNLSEKDRPDISKSNRISIEPNLLERFVITSEGVAVAGKPFTLKIKAVDAYDNVINNYNTTGKRVVLASTGTGDLSPNRVEAAAFVDGLATVEVSYDKAESFSINVYQEGAGAPAPARTAPVASRPSKPAPPAPSATAPAPVEPSPVAPSVPEQVAPPAPTQTALPAVEPVAPPAPVAPPVVESAPLPPASSEPTAPAEPPKDDFSDMLIVN